MLAEPIEMHCIVVMRIVVWHDTAYWLKALAITAALISWLGPAPRASGQEALRMSLAGEASAEARRRVASTPDYYNVQFGPTLWNIATALDLEANDNIRFDSTGAKADLVVRPQINSRMAWRISDQNGLNVSFGAGYSAYVQNSAFNRFFIAPGSELSFDIYAGDFWINLHDRLSITENAYQDPTVVGTGDYSQLQNVAGLNATWDLNKIVVRLGYDHANYTVVTGVGGVPDGASEVFSLSAGYRVAPEILAGLESGGGLLRYSGENAGVTRAADCNVGGFIEAHVTEHVNVRAGVGYTIYAPEARAAQMNAPEFSGVYARLGLDHRVNRRVEYGLSGGRNISYGFFGGTIDLYSAMLQARWHLFQKLGLGTWFQFEHGSQVLAGRETFDRFGPGVSLERSITRKLSGNLRYQYYQRQSDVSGQDYVVNIVTLNLVFKL